MSSVSPNPTRWQTLRTKAGLPPGALFDRWTHALAKLLRLSPWSWPILHGAEVFRDIPYLDTERTEHTLDIYRPRSAGGPLPVILYIHGGAFVSLSKDTHWPLGLLFARRGFLVCIINYRLAPGDRFPAALEDCCAALRWLARDGKRYGADLDRVVLAGESAGANLALALALCSSYARPEPYAQSVFETALRPLAVLSACGLLQATDCARLLADSGGGRWISQLIQMVAQYLPLPAAGASPLLDPLLVLEQAATQALPPARRLPSFFISVGTGDELVSDSRRLARALDQLGVAHEDHYYPDEIHAFHALFWRRQARQCWRDTFAFLHRVCGDPTSSQIAPTASDGH